MADVADRLITRLELAGLAGFIAGMGKAEGALGGLGRAGAMLAVGTIGMIGSEAVKAAIKTDELQRHLDALFGKGSSGQSQAFVEAFAKSTHENLSDATDAFVSLGEQGVQPTMRILSDLAKLANQSGKSMKDVAAPFARALKGDKEALKEFGIGLRDIRQHGYGFEGTLRAVEARTKGVSDSLGGTLRGNLNDLDSSFTLLSRSLGQIALPIMNQVVPVMLTVANAFVKLDQVTDGWSTRLILLFGAGGVILLAIGQIAKLIEVLKGLAIAEAMVEAFQGPKGLIKLAASAAAAGAAAYGIKKAFDHFGDGAGTNAANGAPRLQNQSLGDHSPVSQMIQEIVGGGAIGRLGIKTSELPGLGPHHNPVITVRVEGATHDSLKMGYQHMFNSFLDQLNRHGIFPLGA